jgi:hypothetical protein
MSSIGFNLAWYVMMQRKQTKRMGVKFMNKIWGLCCIMGLPAVIQADQVATSASMSVLQGQVTALNQQMSSAQQTLSNLAQSLQQMQVQSNILKQQIAEYGNVNAKQFKWVDVNDNQIPAHAFIAAENQEKPLYICQANYANNNGYNSSSVLIPGVVSAHGCVITYAGQAYLQPEYAVLTSTVSGYWMSGDQVKNSPPNMPVYPLSFAQSASALSDQPQPLYNALAIIGGQDNSGDTYICRVNINGQYFVGKASSNTCFIATGAHEANWPIYEVLLTRQP